MTDRTLRSITQRLSLRKPQADSLEILAEVLERVTLGNSADTAVALSMVQSLCRELGRLQIEYFERDFPSLCFALATLGIPSIFVIDFTIFPLVNPANAIILRVS
jgi:type III restriction enzyme